MDGRPMKKTAAKKPEKKTLNQWKVADEPCNGYSQEYDVTAREDEKDKNSQTIGRVRFSNYREEEGKPPWVIAHVGRPHEWIFDYESKSNQMAVFNTKKDAAAGLFMIWCAMEANPCPPDIARYLDEESTVLHKAEQALRDQFWTLQRKRRFLTALAKNHNLKVLMAKETTESVKALSDFLDEAMDSIYETFGKDWARSLRARVASVVEEIDPEAAMDF